MRRIELLSELTSRGPNPWAPRRRIRSAAASRSEPVLPGPRFVAVAHFKEPTAGDAPIACIALAELPATAGGRTSMILIIPLSSCSAMSQRYTKFPTSRPRQPTTSLTLGHRLLGFGSQHGAP